MSSEHEAGYGVGYCHDGMWTDGKFCQSANGDTVNPNPWLVFGYRADANISKIVVHNRIDACCQHRIVGASIRICSDSG